MDIVKSRSAQTADASDRPVAPLSMALSGALAALVFAVALGASLMASSDAPDQLVGWAPMELIGP